VHLTVSARALCLALATAACTPRLHNSMFEAGQPVPSSTAVRWQERYAGCIREQHYSGLKTREDLWSSQCQKAGTRDFISLALSGGGTKAAVFSGETMFYLQALGVLQNVSAVSSVSGGSFAGAYYALSCDQNDGDCWARPLRGLRPPPWDYAPAMKTLGSGYASLINEQIIRLLMPGVPATISAPRFADFIDKTYFGVPNPRQARFTFADLNPKRPYLFLNSTIITENRGGLGDQDANGCKGLKGRGYLRRRTPDEFFHFAFTDYYFGLLHSRLADYPVSGGVAASAAFTALIDPAELTDGCDAHTPQSVIKLIDGGANDNQALIELYMILAELVYKQRRSDLRPAPPGKVPLASDELQTLGPEDRAWVMVVNSSVTATTGPAGTASGPQPRNLLSFLFSVANKALDVIDVFTAEGFALRSQLYLAERDRLTRIAPRPLVFPVEISLTQLDQYSHGGTEAALRQKAGYSELETPSMGSPTDIGDSRVKSRIQWQQASYDALVRNKKANEVRHNLHLSRWHPQCYFNIRDRVDASLVSMTEDDQACLREAARWSTALRMQEVCDAVATTPGFAPPQGLQCVDGYVQLPHPEVLSDKLPGTCSVPLFDPTKEPAPDDPDEVCRDLNQPLPVRVARP
jgi:hypothetical protein